MEGPTKGNRIFVGYPSDDGCGSFIDTRNYRFSICSASSDVVQYGSWLFLSYMLSDGFQNEHRDNGFPINTSSYETLADEQLTHEGEEKIVEFADSKVNVGYLTKTEYDRCVNLIENTKHMNSPVDYTVQKIIESEIESLFSNEKNALETANAIQGRVEILLAERM